MIGRFELLGSVTRLGFYTQNFRLRLVKLKAMLPMYEETQIYNNDPETHYATTDNNGRIELNSSGTQTAQKTKTRLRFVIGTALVLISVISLIALVLSVKRDIACHDLQDENEKKDLGTGHIMCGKEWIYQLGHCYFLGRIDLNWTASELKCREMNASLVTIQSKEENKIIVDFLKREGQMERDVYIGLRRNATGVTPRKFVWTDNTTVSFTNWQGHPSLTNHKGQPEECVKIKREFSYRWNDINCSSKEYFLCEKTS